MKENKVNVDLIVPSIGEKFNIFIPVNKSIGEVIVILNQTINSIDNSFPIVNNLSILNVLENTIYDTNVIVKQSNIKNGSILALI